MRYYLTEIIAFILRNCLQQHYPLTRGRVPKKGCLYFGILPNDSFYDPFSDILGASWALGAWEHLEDIFGISWGYLGISLGYLGNIFGISWGYLGFLLSEHTSGVSLDIFCYHSVK